MDKRAAVDRRAFLKLSGLAAIAPGISPFMRAEAQALLGPNADYSLRIGQARVELAPDHIISTTSYNGQFPGPQLRCTEGRRVIVDIFNDTDIPEQLHWHGQKVPVDLDGAAEEGTPYIAAHGMRRIGLTPGPAGLRFYHSHLIAAGNLGAGSLQRPSRSRVHRTPA
jgi:FtsP/CotA-like multicopper oxidase with cupredoxin domain